MFPILPSQEEMTLRQDRIRAALLKGGLDACLLTSNEHLLYALGACFDGYLFLPAKGEAVCFVRRGAEDTPGHAIRKPKDIPAMLRSLGYESPALLGLESQNISAAEYLRLQKVFAPAQIVDCSAIMRTVRAIKTPMEIAAMSITGITHAQVMKEIPHLYQPGMRDIDFEIEIERLLRQNGHLGLFRAGGMRLECYMGQVLAGDNAQALSPCDFALGGEGLHPSQPSGACGLLLEDGMSIMVDLSHNMFGYLTDLSRTYYLGELPPLAHELHKLSVDISLALYELARPGTPCSALFEKAVQMVDKADAGAYFMGTKRKAAFVGHGVGIQINELPVLMGKNPQPLEEGMVLAIEPKFVLPGVGALGIENTGAVTASGLDILTPGNYGLERLG